MGVTIKDVARETNLAISTISKYMNGGKVRKKNEQIIEEAIRKLNYSPNSVARGLRSAKTYRIGLLTGTGDNPHSSAIINEIERVLREKGYALTFMSSGGWDAKLSKEYINFMVDNGVDGLLLTMNGTQADCLQAAREARIPIVCMEECYTDMETDCVQVDCVRGAYEVVEHLIDLGHRKIAVLNGPEEQCTAQERKKGFLRAMEDYGIPVQEEYVVPGDFKQEGGYEGIKKLWSLPEKPTAVFITNYVMCLGAMKAIYELGIKIPEELSIVAFDDFELSVMVRPKLTAVHQPLEEMADAACALLVRRMNGDFEDYPRKIRLKPECMYRDSVLQLRVPTGHYALSRNKKRSDRDIALIEKGK